MVSFKIEWLSPPEITDEHLFEDQHHNNRKLNKSYTSLLNFVWLCYIAMSAFPDTNYEKRKGFRVLSYGKN